MMMLINVFRIESNPAKYHQTMAEAFDKKFVTMKNQQDSILSPETGKNTLFNKAFRDDNGNIVLAQKPNLPILVGLAAILLKLFLPTSGNLSLGLDAVAFGSLFTWAWLELFNGVNYFRQTLGLFVLLGIIASKLSW